MENLTVWKFDDSNGAKSALVTLKGLQEQHLIEIVDAAIVTWPKGKKKPKTHQAINLVGAGALDGAFWGLLFGFLFFVPMFGMAVGAGMGALSGKFSDIGINDNFIKDVKAKVTEGSSALFLLSAAATQDKIHEAFAGINIELIQSNLSNEQAAELRTLFSEE